MSEESKITPMGNDFMQLRLMKENLQEAINIYKLNGRLPEHYEEVLQRCKDYRVAWIHIHSIVEHYRQISDDEHIIDHAKIYNEENTELVKSAIDSLDRHLGFTNCFLQRAAHQEDPL